MPPAFRDQFLLTPDAPYHIVLEGLLDVWHRPRWLAPLFRLLGAAGVLIAESGRAVPTTLSIVAVRDPGGLVVHRYERMLRFKRPVRFTTATVFDPQWQRLVDRTGPRGMLQIIWQARFEPPSTLTQEAPAYALGSGARRWRLPRWLGGPLIGSGRLVQSVDAAQPDRVRLEFAIAHPLLGEIFGYRGTFRVMRAGR